MRLFFGARFLFSLGQPEHEGPQRDAVHHEDEAVGEMAEAASRKGVSASPMAARNRWSRSRYSISLRNAAASLKSQFGNIVLFYHTIMNCVCLPEDFRAFREKRNASGSRSDVSFSGFYAVMSFLLTASFPLPERITGDSRQRAANSASVRVRAGTKASPAA